MKDVMQGSVLVVVMSYKKGGDDDLTETQKRFQ